MTANHLPGRHQTSATLSTYWTSRSTSKAKYIFPLGTSISIYLYLLTHSDHPPITMRVVNIVIIQEYWEQKSMRLDYSKTPTSFLTKNKTANR